MPWPKFSQRWLRLGQEFGRDLDQSKGVDCLIDWPVPWPKFSQRWLMLGQEFGRDLDQSNYFTFDIREFGCLFVCFYIFENVFFVCHYTQTNKPNHYIIDYRQQQITLEYQSLICLSLHSNEQTKSLHHRLQTTTNHFRIPKSNLFVTCVGWVNQGWDMLALAGIKNWQINVQSLRKITTSELQLCEQS